MNFNNQIFRASAIVFSFWWMVLTLISLDWSLELTIEKYTFVHEQILLLGGGLVCGVAIAYAGIMFVRYQISLGLKERSQNGITSLLGPVPMVLETPPRVSSEKARAPITMPRTAEWVEKAKVEHPAHYALFMAIWDVLSEHKHYPASHRKGGHGGLLLWQHSLNVVEKALELAPNWSFEGVFIKKNGKAKTLILPKRNPEYTFDATDPLLPIIALAHDIGKIETYKVLPDGTVETKETGPESDDFRVFHDYIGARMLARIDEYWGLNARDRRTLNLAVGHYHHPGAMPVAEDGFTIDDRITALMEFLIVADKAAGDNEKGRPPIDEEEEYTEDEAAAIYRIFTEVICQYGRVNGIGNKSVDEHFKIAQKHDSLIVIDEPKLREILLQRMGMSMGVGDDRYRITLCLLSQLAEKGILYDTHRGVNFARFLPLHKVSFRNDSRAKHIATWKVAIIIKPSQTDPVFGGVMALPDAVSKLVIDAPLYTHNPNIRNPEQLRALVRKAFGENVADKLTLPPPSTPEQLETPSINQLPATADLPQPDPIVAPPAIVAACAANTEVVPAITPETDKVETIPEVSSDDLPDIGSASGDEGFEDILPPSSPESEGMGAIFDGFDNDFPSVPAAPEPIVAQPPAPPTGLPEAPTQPIVTAEVTSGSTNVEQPRVVSDPDLKNPRVKKGDQGDKLAALSAAREMTTGGGLVQEFASSAGRKKPKVERSSRSERSSMPGDALSTSSRVAAKETPRMPSTQTHLDVFHLQSLIFRGKIPVAGVFNGFSFVLLADIEKALPKSNISDVVSLAGLPVKEASGHKLVGIPSLE